MDDSLLLALALSNKGGGGGTAIAPKFDETCEYYQGQYVTYNGLLYLFVEDHSPGPWDDAEVTMTSVGDIHTVSTFNVDLTNWQTDTSSQSGKTLYKKAINLQHIYSEPTIDIGSATGSVLPSSAEQTAYDLLRYATVDFAVPCLYLYSSAIPVTAYYIKVEGVD